MDEQKKRRKEWEVKMRAKEVAKIADAKRLGIKVGIWVHVPGPKVSCPGHKAWDGKPFLLSEGLYDRDRGKNVLPGIESGCSCTFRGFVPEFGDEMTPEIKALLKKDE